LSFCLILVSLSWANFVPDVPLVAWAGDSSFAGKNLQISQTLFAKDIPVLVASMLSQNHKFDQYVTLHGEPEIVVLFLEPKLRTDEVVRFSSSLPTLSTMLKTSVSSLFSPFINMDEQFVPSLVDVASLTQKNGGSILYHGEGSLLPLLQGQVPVSVVNSILEINSDALLKNGVMDLLLIELHSELPTIQERLKETDQTIALVNEVIFSRTHKYISVYTALQYHTLEESLKSLPSTQKRVYSSIDQVPDDRPHHWFNRWFPNWFWEQAIIWIIMIVISFVGIMALFGLQTPNKLPRGRDAPRK